MSQPLSLDTIAVQGLPLAGEQHGSFRPAVYNSVAFEFDSAGDIEDAFRGRRPAHAYSRISNPTVDAFEKKITALEQGFAALATASGMAAIANVLVALVQQGENIVAANNLFGGTYSLLKNTLAPLGVEVHFADVRSREALQTAVDEKTRLIFFETLANPAMSFPDIAMITSFARERGIVTVVDSTLTTSYLFHAKDFGVNVVVHSCTKFMSAGASVLGGVLVDLGTMDWTRVPALKKYAAQKKFALIARLRREVFRDLGACLPAQSAFLLNLGLETLPLRMEKSCANALAVAQFLDAQPQVVRVAYPGLKSSPDHELATRQFSGRYGSILAFELATREAAFAFIDRLRLFHRATNIGDNISLAIHPASTIFCEYSAEEKVAMGVPETLVRLSVGIEQVDDLIADIGQAL